MHSMLEQRKSIYFGRKIYTDTENVYFDIFKIDVDSLAFQG